jgi:DNA mismatch repair protein MutS
MSISEKIIPSTPMMRQYARLKQEYADSILLFRMGDFYEMFGQDAVTASKILEIALTSRDRNKPNAVPLCGIPYHAVDGYIAKLITRGHKVAVCEQVGNTKAAKGLVKREVVRVITPGTLLESNLLTDKQNNYLMAILLQDRNVGLAVLDISTAEFMVTQFGDEQGNRLENELARLQPREILLPKGLTQNGSFMQFIKQQSSAHINPLEDWVFDYHQAYSLVTECLHTLNLEGFGCQKLKLATSAAGAALYYAQQTQRAAIEHIHRLRVYHLEDYMLLDAATQANLELVCSSRESSRKDSLLGVMDYTVTALGGRLLKKWLLHPLLKLDEVVARHEAVGELKDKGLTRRALRQKLECIHDLERLISRISLAVASARDVVSLGASLQAIPDIKQTVADFGSPLIRQTLMQCDELTDVAEAISQALVDNPPLALKEGGLIRQGYDRQLDELRGICRDGKGWIARLEARERERSGISSLKVRFNRVFGYYIEVTKPNLHLVPEDYIRKQTLVNAERFITPQLKEYEEKVLGAEERINELEFELFCRIREQVARHSQRIQQTAQALAQLDVLAALAELASRANYVRPVMSQSNAIEITEGRHPVLEQLSPDKPFVANDTRLDGAENQLLIITGPNMAGKSTYIRQVALIVLMAQMGSFVPAKSANLGIVDRIFTRVGAADNLVKGQSTFMVEMSETANILNNATSRSLIVLDEIGRGTSTYDGLSIAWAVAEYIHDRKRIGAKTLFATHYHELTDLALTLPGIKNYNIAVREYNDQIIFLYKVLEGSTDRSYGIQVAKLAGLPEEVIQRAKEILSNLEQQELNEVGQPKLSRSAKPAAEKAGKQLSLFLPAQDAVLKEIRGLNISGLTPLEALNKLANWQERLKGEG